jgi:predicted aspartyl protease
MTVLLIICLLLITCELATIFYYRKLRFKETNDYHDITEFKTKISKTGLIYVPFTCNGKELNFLLDTGSTISYIDAQTASELGCKFQKCNESVTGLGGNQEITEYCEVKLETSTTVTEIELPLTNFKHAFSQIKEESGIEIHGLLGNNFLQASKYVIDYDKMMVFKPKHKNK